MDGGRRSSEDVPGRGPGLARSTTSRTATAATWPSAGPTRTGEEQIVITATGSQKGDLDRSQICFLSPSETDYGYYKASSETDIHARILSLPGVRASMHAHTKDLVIATLDDGPKPPAALPPFVPVDPLGYYHLGGSVPIDWFAVPSGSPEMARTDPRAPRGERP